MKIQSLSAFQDDLSIVEVPSEQLWVENKHEDCIAVWTTRPSLLILLERKTDVSDTVYDELDQSIPLLILTGPIL